MKIGVIIDTFTSLTEELQTRENDKTQFCYICGLSRDEVEKTMDSRNGFVSHIKVLKYKTLKLINVYLFLEWSLYVELHLL